MDAYATKNASAIGYSAATPKEPTLTNDVSITLARVEGNEATARRIRQRIFGSSLAPQEVAEYDAASITDVNQDILRISRSADRTREILDEMEKRLG